MDYNIKFQPSTQLYYARIPDGSRYGRKITAKTKQALMDKLKNLWVMPSKQTKNAMTVGELMQGFIAYMEKRSLAKIDGKDRIRPQTLRSYKLHYKNVWDFENNEGFYIFGKKIIEYKVHEVDLKFMQEFSNEVELKFSNHSLKYKTNIKKDYKSCFLWLHEQDENLYPLNDVRKFKIKNVKPNPFVPKRLDAQKLLKTVDEICKPKYAIFVHLCARGLRASEANALKPSDFDWSKNTVHVQRMIDCSRNLISIETGYEKSTKTESSNRKVPIGAELAKRIRKYIMSNKLEWLFQSEVKYDGKPMKQSSLTHKSRGIHKAIKELGADIEWKGAMHGLRHYYGSLLMAEAHKLGRNPEWVQKNLGHSDLQTTFNIYSHDIDEDNHELNNKIEKLLNG